MEIKTIKIKDLATNDGQIEGLPKNPRQIRDHRYEKLKKSIEDAPEMLKLRELLVYPIDGGKFVVIGGNMRLRACKELGYKTLPCKVLDVATPPPKIARIRDKRQRVVWRIRLGYFSQRMGRFRGNGVGC